MPLIVTPGQLARRAELYHQLGSTVAGPFCTRLFADFGAEVIKVEHPDGDAVRGMGKRMNGKSLYAASILRNKRIVSIEMKTPRGRELVADLAKDGERALLILSLDGIADPVVKKEKEEALRAVESRAQNTDARPRRGWPAPPLSAAR